jgi:hypothetical protein
VIVLLLFYDENKTYWEGQSGFGAEKKSKIIATY